MSRTRNGFIALVHKEGLDRTDYGFLSLELVPESGQDQTR
jgi:hypothetical protein